MLLNVIFPEAVRTAGCPPGLYRDQLFPEEWSLVEGSVEKRQAEFCGGRLSAHQAIRQLGLDPGPILTDPDRSPIWPAGIVGSISHTDGYCCAAVARKENIKAIGLDVEVDTPLEEDLIEQVCLPEEKQWLSGQTAATRGTCSKLIFCAKEAAYKCQYPLTKQFFELHEAHATIDLENQQFSVEFVERPNGIRSIRGHFRIADGFIFAGACLEK